LQSTRDGKWERASIHPSTYVMRDSYACTYVCTVIFFRFFFLYIRPSSLDTTVRAWLAGCLFFRSFVNRMRPISIMAMYMAPFPFPSTVLLPLLSPLFSLPRRSGRLPQPRPASASPHHTSVVARKSRIAARRRRSSHGSLKRSAASTVSSAGASICGQFSKRCSHHQHVERVLMWRRGSMLKVNNVPLRMSVN
jgi:hypothetical protein